MVPDTVCSLISSVMMILIYSHLHAQLIWLSVIHTWDLVFGDTSPFYIFTSHYPVENVSAKSKVNHVFQLYPSIFLLDHECFTLLILSLN